MTQKNVRSWSENISDETIAVQVIHKLGGVSEVHRASAEFNDGKPIATSTIWSWMHKGHIPKKRWEAVLAVARAKGVKVKESDLNKALPVRG